MSIPACLESGAPFADRYLIERQLGSGGMASVWLAYDQTLERACALKVLDPEQATNLEARRRFHREARVTAQIRSAGVVNIFDHGEWRDQLYIAMEYLEGEDLASRLARQGKLDLQQTGQVVARVALGLAHAHASGVVHRDIKPENIFLSHDAAGETAKVLDFGIAKQVARSASDKVTQSGLFLGTPLYASPEQIRSQSVDFRTDLWSLAIVTFECLTGRAPFISNSLGELCGLILFQPVPRFTEHDSELPVALDAWLLRALAREPERRYQSAKELADAFAEAAGCARVSLPSLPPRPELPSLSGEPVSRAAVPPAERRALPCLWRPMLIVALAAAAVMGVAVKRARSNAGIALPAATAVNEPAVSAAAEQAPQVSVADLPGDLDEVCRARLRNSASNEREVSVAHKSRAPIEAKPKSAVPPVSLDKWRLQPGF